MQGTSTRTPFFILLLTKTTELEKLLAQPSYTHPDPPPWNRTVDIVCHAPIPPNHVPGSLDNLLDADTLETVFPEHLAVERISLAKKKTGYKDLPPSIRRKIWGYIVKPHATPVTLSHLAFTRQTWSLESLTQFQHAWSEIKPYLITAPTVRMDVLLTFLSVNTFHVTLTPHVGPRLSPLATTWFNKYGAWMESIILEVDMTKFGLSAKEGADQLAPGMRVLEDLVKDVAKAQKGRKIPLRELTLLCRRYFGEREYGQEPSARESWESIPAKTNTSTSSEETVYQPVQRVASPMPLPLFHRRAEKRNSYEPRGNIQIPKQGNSSSSSSSGSTYSDETVLNSRTPSPMKAQSPKKLYYCPNYHLTFLNALYAPLHTKVTAIRMCGFSEKYTHALARALFPIAKGRCVFRLGPSNGAWPRLVGQRSWIDDGRGEAILDVVEEDDDVGSFVWMGTKMPPRPVRDEHGGLSLPREMKYRQSAGEWTAKSVKTTSSAGSNRTMSRSKRFKRFLAGAGAKTDSIRDSRSSKGDRVELMSELPGYV